MNKTTVLQSRVPVEEIAQIESKVQASDLISSGFDTDLLNPYSINDYLYHRQVHGATFHAVLDRNLVSSLTRAARAETVTTEDEQQAIALLNFLRLSEVQLEPGIALAEYADTYHAAEPDEELHLLRKIDNIPNDNLHDLSLGKTDKVLISKSTYQKSSSAKIELGRAEHIHQWNLHYGFVLKMHLLHHEGLSMHEFAKKYLLWMWEEYILGGVAFPFAVIFASGRFGRMIKGINSLTHDKVLKGLRNAAWDMTIVHYWCDRVVHRREGAPFCIFCSADNGLKAVARHILASGNKSLADGLNSLFGSSLSKKERREVITLYESLIKDSGNLSRAGHGYRQKQGFFDPLIQSLEREALHRIDKRSRNRSE